MTVRIDENGNLANLVVPSIEAAESAIFAILEAYAQWMESHLDCDFEVVHTELKDQFANQEFYGYELPLTELRRTGKIQEWTPHPLRIYVNKDPRSGGQRITVYDNGDYRAVESWIPAELETV